jgi:phosphohistidine swiveling domain-containing protein
MDVQRAKSCVFAPGMVYVGYVNSSKIHGIDVGKIFIYLKEKTDFFQIMPYESIMDIAKKAYYDYLKDENSFVQKLKKQQEIADALDKSWKKYKISFTNEELLRFYDDFIKLSREWWDYGIMGEDKGNVINSEIVPFFEKRYRITKSKAEEIVSILSHPSEKALFSIERMDFFEICLYILSFEKLEDAVKSLNIIGLKKDKELSKKIDEYNKKYFYKNADFYDRRELTFESTIKEVKEEITKNNKKAIEKSIAEIKKADKEISARRKKILNEIKISATEKKAIEFASKYIVWIDIRKINMMKQFYYVFCLLHYVAERLRISYEEISTFTVEEVHDILSGKAKLNKDEAKKRQAKVMLIYQKDKPLEIYYGRDAEQMFEIAKGVAESKNELKGFVASRGSKGDVIRGKARIVIDALKDRFEEGEILITSMTRIEFVPLMKKAKMIITDEGGIACHAAIVSRELGIPCIVGTKYATHIIKSGDIIEADLKEGRVRIK